MYIARQPIFNTELQVYAYELLYRSSIAATTFGGVEGNVATATVLAGLFNFGFEEIVGNKKAFVNFDEDLLFTETPYMVSSSKLVVEVLETVEPSEKILSKLKQLRKEGYAVALDDFGKNYDDYPLVETANIIKYDILQTPLDELKGAVEKTIRDGKVALAEKIETYEEFIKAKEMGFKLFQGYFFSKPYIVGQYNSEKSYTVEYSVLIAELHKEEPSFDELSRIFETNVDLAYRVFILAGVKRADNNLKSMKEALLKIGINDLILWISVLMIKDSGARKPTELTRLSLTRAKFAEKLVANKIFPLYKKDAFLLGLFSTIDALLDKKMEDIVQDLPFSDELKAALVQEPSEYNKLYDFMLSYENGTVNADDFEFGTNKDKMELVSKLYIEAVRWQDSVLSSIQGV